MKKYLVISGMIIGMFISVQLSTAQDDPGDQIDEALEYTYGSVVSVSPTQIIISEYNYESDEEVQAPYVLNDMTKFNNMNGVQDLAKDDNVDIYFKVSGDQKVASMITKDESVYESGEDAEIEESNSGEVMNELSNETFNPVAGPETQTNASVNDTRG